MIFDPDDKRDRDLLRSAEDSESRRALLCADMLVLMTITLSVSRRSLEAALICATSLSRVNLLFGRLTVLPCRLLLFAAGRVFLLAERPFYRHALRELDSDFQKLFTCGNSRRARTKSGWTAHASFARYQPDAGTHWPV